MSLYDESGQIGHRSIDEVIADTLKDEMIDGINNNPGVLVSSANYDSGNHSVHNSDDGETDSRSPQQIGTSLGHHDDYESTTLQSFTHLTNATDASHVLNRDVIYSSTPLLGSSSVGSGITTTIIQQIPAYDNVLHPNTPGRLVYFLYVSVFVLDLNVSKENRRKRGKSVHRK